jgi:predicted kinase
MRTTTGLVILVRGLPGVGKSTVADMLRARLAPAVRVNEDTIRYLALPRDFTDVTVIRAQFACADLAKSYALSGAAAIIDGVMADRDVVGVTVPGVHCHCRSQRHAASKWRARQPGPASR